VERSVRTSSIRLDLFGLPGQVPQVSGQESGMRTVMARPAEDGVGDSARSGWLALLARTADGGIAVLVGPEGRLCVPSSPVGPGESPQRLGRRLLAEALGVFRPVPAGPLEEMRLPDGRCWIYEAEDVEPAPSAPALALAPEVLATEAAAGRIPDVMTLALLARVGLRPPLPV
jgi:hypothetical protein